MIADLNLHIFPSASQGAFFFAPRNSLEITWQWILNNPRVVPHCIEVFRNALEQQVLIVPHCSHFTVHNPRGSH